MKYKNFFRLILRIVVPGIFTGLFPFFCSAGLLNPTLKSEVDKQAEVLVGGSLDTTYSVSGVVSLVISGFLSFLGIIFIILIIIAGYNWMTARGEEQKVEKAKETIQRAIIGLIIIIAAYAITYFVFQRLPGGTGLGGSSMGS